MRVLPFNALYPQVDLITDSDAFFKLAKERYQEYVSSGFYVEDNKESYFIYRIKDGDYANIGIIGSADINDIKDNKILAHEKTLASKEQHMMHLLLQRQAMIKPTLVAYDDDTKINAFIAEYIANNIPFLDLSLEDSKEFHTFWRVSKKKDVTLLKERFREVHRGYIADGHHRCSTIAKLYQNDSIRIGEDQNHGILSAYFAFSQLKIYDFNRVISLADRIDLSSFLIQLSKYAKLEPIKGPRKAKRKFELTFYVDQSWFKLTWKNKVIQKYSRNGIVLDYYIFNWVIMNKILGIEDVTADDTTVYIEGTKGIEAVEKATNNGEFTVGFCLYPVSKAELKIMAQKGIPMPPKSTAFVPRIKNGMIVQKL